MHSRATDRRSASKCQGKWPDQTLDQAFGLPEVLVAVSTSRLSCKRAGENANIDAGLGFIWRISANTVAVWKTAPESLIAVEDITHRTTLDTLHSCEINLRRRMPA